MVFLPVEKSCKGLVGAHAAGPAGAPVQCTRTASLRPLLGILTAKNVGTLSSGRKLCRNNYSSTKKLAFLESQTESGERTRRDQAWSKSVKSVRSPSM